MSSSWGSIRLQPNAPFLYEVAGHVKNRHFGDYYYCYYREPACGRWRNGVLPLLGARLNRAPVRSGGGGGGEPTKFTVQTIAIINRIIANLNVEAETGCRCDRLRGLPPGGARVGAAAHAPL